MKALRAILALEDGFVLEGTSFTGPIEDAGGEVIFNTGMTGYQEILTDPSYCGQMVCMTWPLIGNYGINPDDVESSRIHVRAFIVKECCKEPSNWRSTETVPQFLMRHKVPGIEGVDTRALTLHLRTHGALRGAISTSLGVDELVAKARAITPMEGQNLSPLVAPRQTYRWAGNPARPESVTLNPDGSYTWPGDATLPRVIVYDYGIKWNILRLLSSRGLNLLVVPPTFAPEQARATGAEAVFLSNGPGDPAAMKEEIGIITQLVDMFPTAGICLGHQLLGHALGGTTKKLKFGHHGCNHPVKNLETGRIEISSQNHGFHVINDNLVMTHVNLNDGTMEGFRHPVKPIIAVQHHPEVAPGPNDCRSFFAMFRQMLKEQLGK